MESAGATHGSPEAALDERVRRAPGIRWLRDPRAWILVLLSVPLFFLGAGSIPLIDPDEPYYAVPALEMLRHGSWHVSLLHGTAWFDKPILFYWVIAAAYRIFGVTEFAARVGSCLAAMGGMLAIYGFGQGHRRAESSFAAAVVLGTSLQYALLGRAAMTDMTFTLFITLGMLATAGLLDSGRLRWSAGAGAAFGLAVLTKGPAGLILPVAGLAAYVAISRRFILLRPRVLGAAAAGALLTSGPWYLYMAMAHRDLLVKTFLGEGNLGRFLHPEHASSPYFYLVVLFLGMIPWSGALPAALISAVSASRSMSGRTHRGTHAKGIERVARREIDEADNHAVRRKLDKYGGLSERREEQRGVDPLFALCWFGGIMVVFSLSASKLLTYILPAFPPAALLIGQYWTGTLGDAARERPTLGTARANAGAGAGAGDAVLAGTNDPGNAPGRRTFSSVTADHPPPARSRSALVSAAMGFVLACAVSLLCARAALRGDWGVSLHTVALMGTALTAGAVLALWAIWRSSLRGLLAAQATTGVILVLLGLGTAGPELTAGRSARDLVADLESNGLTGEIVGAYREKGFSLDFYLGQTLPRVRGMRSLERMVQVDPGKIWIVPDADLEAVLSDSNLRGDLVVRKPSGAAVRLNPAGSGRSGT